MKFLSGAILVLAALSCTACANQKKLKTPCTLPALAASYASDDCGPLLPVNEALNNAAPPTQ